MLCYLPSVSTAFLVLGMVLPMPPVWLLQGGKRYGGRGYSLRGVASLDSLAGLIQLGNNCELAPLLMTGRRGDFLH